MLFTFLLIPPDFFRLSHSLPPLGGASRGKAFVSGGRTNLQVVLDSLYAILYFKGYPVRLSPTGVRQIWMLNMSATCHVASRDASFQAPSCKSWDVNAC